jgi:sugar phosphate isomerase/epimerase
MQGRAANPVSRPEALHWLAESLEQLGLHAQARGQPLLFEPLNRYETNLVNQVSEALALLEPLRTRNVKLLCDCFHMNIEEDSLPASLRLAGARLGHVHFADSNRRAVGLGHTDFGPVAEALTEMKYEGYLSAEILPLPDPETAAAQTLASFRRYCHSPGQTRGSDVTPRRVRPQGTAPRGGGAPPHSRGK